MPLRRAFGVLQGLALSIRRFWVGALSICFPAQVGLKRILCITEFEVFVRCNVD